VVPRVGGEGGGGGRGVGVNVGGGCGEMWVWWMLGSGGLLYFPLLVGGWGGNQQLTAGPSRGQRKVEQKQTLELKKRRCYYPGCRGILSYYGKGRKIERCLKGDRRGEGLIEAIESQN